LDRLFLIYPATLLDHETALSAVRNLNGKDVGGRPLRIDLADSDPFLEGRTTMGGQIIEGHHPRLKDEKDLLANLPPGVPIPPGMSSMDVITRALTDIKPSQVLDVLAQMKVCQHL
jgi:cleavage stimulation factor subunit 2